MKREIEILVVDDDRELAETLRDLLVGEGYTVAVALSAGEALAVAEQNPQLAIALLDLIMPQCDGMALMEELHRRNRSLPVIIMTGFGTIETAVDAIKRGAEDYLTKPFDREAVQKKIGRLMEVHRLRHRVAELEADLKQVSDPFQELLYVSRGMQQVVERARTAAESDATVLIVGETGTGKEKLARAIHRASRRASGPFVAVNCGALPKELIESELFGVRKGAYTGAYSDRPGVFAAAARGTVFLDEIGEMPKEAQVKLLRVLQEREARPVGGTTARPVDVRVVAATNKPITALRTEHMREDLYFRLATVVVEIPPLRARREDVLVLAQCFCTRLAERYGRHITLNPAAVEALLGYGFPGNVRELENILESAAAVSKEDPQVISDRDVRPLLHTNGAAQAGWIEQPMTLEEMEKIAIERALRLCQGNRTRAAALLGISRDTLYRKLRDLNIAVGTS
jgi:DNA-binding NtrC family response regulator